MSRVNAAIPKLIIRSFIFSSENSIRKLLMSVDGITAQGSRLAMDLLPSSVIFPVLYSQYPQSIYKDMITICCNMIRAIFHPSFKMF